MQYKITIPEPCTQHWDSMIPDDTGRYCLSCQKSVIDFTAKTDEEIQAYIISNLGQSICGRFRNSQVNRIVIELPGNILRVNMPGWMCFLVACLLVFGASLFPFETTLAGKYPAELSFYQGSPVAVKTVKKPGFIKKKKKGKRKRKQDILEPYFIPGEWHTMGFMPTPERFPPVYALLDSIPKTDHTPDQQLGINKETLPGKKERPAPYAPTEAILPALLAIRKENSNGTMD